MSGWSLNKRRPLAVSCRKKDDRSSNDADNRELTFQPVLQRSSLCAQIDFLTLT